MTSNIAKEILYPVTGGSCGRDIQSSTVLSSNSLAEEREEGLNPSVGEPTETADLKPWEFMEDGPAVREP